MILHINGPLRPQVIDEDKPVAGQREEIEEGRSQMEERRSEVEEGGDGGTTDHATKAEKRKLGKSTLRNKATAEGGQIAEMLFSVSAFQLPLRFAFA
jgi:hypothetical protein